MSNSFVDIIENGQTPPLGGSLPKKQESAKELLACTPSELPFMIEVTLTHPHVQSWLKLTSDKQKVVISRIFDYLCAAIPIQFHLVKRIYYEYDKNGSIHGHGYLKCSAFKHYPLGAICDMAKAALCHYPKRYSKFYDSSIFADWGVYRSPQLKLKYDTMESSRVPEWEAYCMKLQ